jgi:hypothetical protein
MQKNTLTLKYESVNITGLYGVLQIQMEMKLLMHIRKEQSSHSFNATINLSLCEDVLSRAYIEEMCNLLPHLMAHI